MWYVAIRKDGNAVSGKSECYPFDRWQIALRVRESFLNGQPHLDSREDAEKYLNDVTDVVVTVNHMADLIKMSKGYSGPKMLEIRRAFRELLEEEDQGWDW